MTLDAHAITADRTPRHRHSHPPVRALIAVTAVAFFASAAPAQYQLGDRTPGLKNETPAQVKGLELQNRLGNRVPLDLPFTDAAGKKIRLAELFNHPARDAAGKALTHDKPVVLIMAYFRCPLLCPMVLDKFTRTLRELDLTAGRDYDAIVVSFDHRDTSTDAASRLNAQVLAYGRGTGDDVRSGFSFLVGEPENTRSLADALGFPYRFLPESGEFSHPTAVFILTPDGRLSRVLTGLDYPADAVRMGLVEASGGKIGGLFDKFTFWCFHFDSASGKYSLKATRVMQVGGVAGTIFLAGLVGGFLWREQRRRRSFPAAHAAA